MLLSFYKPEKQKQKKRRKYRYAQEVLFNPSWYLVHVIAVRLKFNSPDITPAMQQGNRALSSFHRLFHKVKIN